MKGTVKLVGAGCGRGLISIMGVKAIEGAESLVYDDLIDDELLGYAPSDCKKIYVGKRYAKHSKTQEEINRILIDEAKAGKRVVRLKGGDSFVFGRGGEEYLALEAEGINCRLIPGISSSIAVPESLGIPVTHRKMAQSFTVITGHTATDMKEDYSALAKMRGTLVFLMGLNSLSEITSELIRCGKPAKIPASIVCRGFSGRERRIDGTLGTIAEEAVRQRAETPGILVVGEVAGFHMESRGDEKLSGKRVCITGTKSFMSRLKTALEEEGAFVESVETLSLEKKAENIPNDFSEYDWIIFTSANGIDIFFDELKVRDIDIRKISHMKFACIGRGTEEKLRRQGIIADFVPEKYTARTLGKEIARKLNKREKLLILRAEKGSVELTEELENAGVSFDDIKIYDTKFVPGKKGDDERIGDCHYIVFASAQGIKSFLSGHEIPENSKIVCIGDITAKELRTHTDRKFLSAGEHSVRGILEIICEAEKL